MHTKACELKSLCQCLFINVYFNRQYLPNLPVQTFSAIDFSLLSFLIKYCRDDNFPFALEPNRINCSAAKHNQMENYFSQSFEFF